MNMAGNIKRQTPVPHGHVFRLWERSTQMSGRKRRIHCFIGVPLAVGLLLLSGCATRNYRAAYSGQMISQGEKAIDDANASNASQNAPDELTAAEEKLSLAKAAFARDDHDNAAQLAEEAAVAAAYAQAKATTEKNKKIVEEMRKNIEVLKKEIELQSK
jgi:hypothetical protein